MRDFITIVEHGLLNMPRGGVRTDVTTRPHILNNPAFVSWFNGSKVADREGNPIVCFHGTFFDFSKFHHVDKGRGGAGNGFNRLGFWFDTDHGVPNWLAGYEEGSSAVSTGGVVYPCFLSIKRPFAMDSAWLTDADRDEMLAIMDELNTLSQRFYQGRRDDLGNLRLPDGSVFTHKDELRLRDLRKERDELIKSLHTDRDDGWYRLMRALPKGLESSTQEVAEFQADLIAQGYDGIWIGDTIADFGSRNYKLSDWWIAFHPNQIKSIHAKDFDPDSDHMHESAS